MDPSKPRTLGPESLAWRFGGFILEPGRGTLLWPDGTEVGLRPKTAEILQLLARQAGRVVSREELMQAVWPDVVVTDDSITQCVTEIRRALGEAGTDLVRTLPKRGYLLAAEVTRMEGPASPATAAASDTSATLPPPRAPDQGEAPTSGPGPAIQSGAERRQLTLLFCGLAGAVSVQPDPEDLRDIVAAYQHTVAAVIQRHGGYVARHLGGWVVAYFGWPTAHEDDAERAVRAALAAIEAVAELTIVPATSPLRPRIGIATGLVVVGDHSGEGEAGKREVAGVTPNHAAKLQVKAEPGTVVIDAATRRLTGALFDYAEFEGVALQRLSGPERSFRVLGESRIESRFEALRGGAAHLPLIGREEELDLLLRRWRQVRSGEGRVVLLQGEAGIGKSRLVAALQEELAAGDHEALVLYCSPQHTNSALRPMIARLERAAGITPSGAPEVRLFKLEALLTPLAPPPEDVALIADLLAIPTLGRWPVLDLPPSRRRERLLEALLRWVRALAARGPVLMVVEDAHWADPTTREWLDLLVADAPGMALLLVVTHRPEFDASAWLGLPQVTPLQLNRLRRPEHAALLRRAAGGKALPAVVEDEILTRTDGVPLFLEEVAKAVLEGGLLREEADRWVLDGPLPPLAVPPTLQASLVARLDRLASMREVAQAGAVIGREFSHEVVAAVSGLPEARLCEALAQLEDADLVQRRGAPPAAVYAFKHALVQDAAYGTLLRARRSELHRRAAEAIGRLRPQVTEREPQLLAWHYTRAGLADPAIRHWRRAGERSVARFANHEAIGHFQQTLELLERLAPGEDRDRLEADLRLALTVPLIAVHGFGSQAVEACAARAKELGDRLPGWPGLFAAQRLVWSTCLTRDTVPRAVVLARELLASAEPSGEPVQLVAACRALGYSRYIAGELAEADPLLARAVMLADCLEDINFATYGEDPRIVCRIYHGQVRGLLGYPEAALRLGREGLTRARAYDNPHAVPWALIVLAQLYVLLRDVSEVERAAAEASDLARRHGFPQWLGFALPSLGWALCHRGQVADGLALLEEGVRRMRETGAHLHTTKARYLFAESCLLAGQPEAALDHLRIAHGHAGRYGERYLVAETHRLWARVLRTQDAAVSECEGHLHAALKIAHHQAARLWELRAACDLARLWRDQGQTTEAHRVLAPVYAAFAEGFTFPDLVEARTLMDELAPGSGRIGEASGIASTFAGPDFAVGALSGR